MLVVHGAQVGGLGGGQVGDGGGGAPATMNAASILLSFRESAESAKDWYTGLMSSRVMS